MNKKELAAALGISGAMVTKLSKRGMPVDDVEKAVRWRRRHLEWTRSKGVRIDTIKPRGAGGAPRARTAVSPPAQAAASPRGAAVVLGDAAFDAFDWAGPDVELRVAECMGLLAANDFDRYALELRIFMRLIPRADRCRLGLPSNVWTRLYGEDLLAAIAPGYDPVTGTRRGPPVPPDDQPTEETNHILFDLACGLRRLIPK